MRWLVGVMEHIVGFIEQTGGEPTPAQRAELVKSQRAELANRGLLPSSRRAGGQAGRIVCFTGMLIGTVIVALLAGAAALALWVSGAFDGSSADELGTIFLCCAAGAVGSLVSVMSRLRPVGVHARLRGRPPARPPARRLPPSRRGRLRRPHLRAAGERTAPRRPEGRAVPGRARGLFRGGRVRRRIQRALGARGDRRREEDDRGRGRRGRGTALALAVSPRSDGAPPWRGPGLSPRSSVARSGAKPPVR